MRDGVIRLTPGHVHRALRRLAGIEERKAARQFPLPDEDLDLFS